MKTLRQREDDQHEDLCLAEPLLLRIFRAAERCAMPEPTPTTLERAHVLLTSRRKGPCRAALPHDPRKCACTQSRPSNGSAAPDGSAQESRGRKSNFPPHGALGSFALTTTSLVASTPTSTSGVGRLGDGGRGAPRDGAKPCASRRASHSSSELDADSVARGASEAGAEGAEGPEASTGG